MGCESERKNSIQKENVLHAAVLHPVILICRYTGEEDDPHCGIYWEGTQGRDKIWAGYSMNSKK